MLVTAVCANRCHAVVTVRRQFRWTYALDTSVPVTVRPARNALVHPANEDSQKRQSSVPTRVSAVHLLDYHQVPSVTARVVNRVRRHPADHAHSPNVDDPFHSRILARHVHPAHLVSQFWPLHLLVLRHLAENWPSAPSVTFDPLRSVQVSLGVESLTMRDRKVIFVINTMTIDKSHVIKKIVIVVTRQTVLESKLDSNTDENSKFNKLNEGYTFQCQKQFINLSETTNPSKSVDPDSYMWSEERTFDNAVEAFEGSVPSKNFRKWLHFTYSIRWYWLYSTRNILLLAKTCLGILFWQDYRVVWNHFKIKDLSTSNKTLLQRSITFRDIP